MRTLTSVITLALALCAVALCQDPPETQFAVIGAGFNSAGSPQTAGIAAYARRIAEGTYSYSSASLVAGKPTTVETGVAKLIFRPSPKVAVLGLATAGAAMGNESFGAAFSGGGMASVDLGQWLKGARAVAGVKASKTSISDVQPSVFFGLAFGF